LWFVGLGPLLRWVFSVAIFDRSIRTAQRVAEALRRIEPDLTSIPQLGSD